MGTEEGIEISFCDVKIQAQNMLANVSLACHRRDRKGSDKHTFFLLEISCFVSSEDRGPCFTISYNEISSPSVVFLSFIFFYEFIMSLYPQSTV